MIILISTRSFFYFGSQIFFYLPVTAPYDTILLGFPIWWYVAPRIIQTFLETYDFSGKKIVLFATSGGSGFGKAADELKQDVPASAVIEEGAILNSEQAVKALAKRFS